MTLMAATTVATMGTYASSEAALTVAPRLSGDVEIELNRVSSIGPNSQNDPRHLTYAEIGFNNVLQLTPGVEIYSGLMLEPVQDATEDSAVFDRHGLFAETLGLALSGESNTVWLGKFNASFGLAWDHAPGIFGDDFADDLEITEKVGVSGEHIVTGPITDRPLVLGWSLYQADRSVLSHSLITHREPLRLEDGGPANTTGLRSGSISLDGSFPIGEANLGYHAAYRSEAFEDATLDSQNGHAVAVEYQQDFSTGRMALFYEWARLRHFDGMDNRRDYHVAGVRWQWNQWVLSMASSSRRQEGLMELDDTLLQLNFGYLPVAGGQVDVAWRVADADGAGRQQQIGLRYTRALDYQL